MWTYSAFGTDLTVTVGQQGTYIALHEDEGVESVWSLLVEGQKLWIVGRPESDAVMRRELPSDATPRSQPAAR